MADPLLTDEKAADKSKDYNGNHKSEAFIRRPAIRATYDPGNRRIKGLDVVETLSHAVHNLIDVFAVMQRRPQSSSEELLDHSR